MVFCKVYIESNRMMSSYWVIVLARSYGHSQDKFKTLFVTYCLATFTQLPVISVCWSSCCFLSVKFKSQGKKCKSAISAVSSKEMMAKERVKKYHGTHYIKFESNRQEWHIASWEDKFPKNQLSCILQDDNWKKMYILFFCYQNPKLLFMFSSYYFIYLFIYWQHLENTLGYPVILNWTRYEKRLS